MSKPRETMSDHIAKTTLDTDKLISIMTTRMSRLVKENTNVKRIHVVLDDRFHELTLADNSLKKRRDELNIQKLSLMRDYIIMEKKSHLIKQQTMIEAGININGVPTVNQSIKSPSNACTKDFANSLKRRRSECDSIPVSDICKKQAC
jgi:hypothetical protein